MKPVEILARFPEKKFSESFKERELALIAIHISQDDIDLKKDQFKKIFVYDQLIQEIEHTIRANETDIDEYIANRIIYHLENIKRLKSLLDLLNLSARNIHDVFIEFDNTLVNSLGLLGNISYKVDGHTITLGDTLIDNYIYELHDILEKRLKEPIDLTSAKEVNKIVKELIINKESYDKAEESAQAWLNTQEKMLEMTIEKQKINFTKKAEKHTGFWKVGIRLLTSIFAGIIVFCIVAGFIYVLDTEDKIGIGSAILRVSSMIVPGYFALFCAQQYMNQKKLHEIYTFKYIALEVMNDLTRTEYNNVDERKKIIDKGMNVIFNEPSFKEETYDKKLIQDVLDIVKNKQ